MCVLGILIVGKGYKIQTEDNGYWSALADSLSTDLVSIPAERGNIYSADGGLLATSLPYFELRVDFASPCLLYTSPSPRDKRQSRMPSSA